MALIPNVPLITKETLLLALRIQARLEYPAPHWETFILDRPRPTTTPGSINDRTNEQVMEAVCEFLALVMLHTAMGVAGR